MSDSHISAIHSCGSQNELVDVAMVENRVQCVLVRKPRVHLYRITADYIPVTRSAINAVSACERWAST